MCSRIVDARLLRVQALLSLGHVAGAVNALSSIVRCVGLPHNGGTPVVPAIPGAPTPAPTSEPVLQPEGFKAIGPLAPYHNHLPPDHRLNRAALAWLANPYANVLDKHVCGLQPALAAAVGPVVAARAAIARADILTFVASAASGAVTAGLTGEQWGDGEYAAVPPRPYDAVTAVSKRDPRGPERAAAVLSESKLQESGWPEAAFTWGGAAAADVVNATLEVR